MARARALATGNRFVDYMIGGWQVNAIGSGRSGQPYNLSVPGDSANTGNTGYLRPNLVGDPVLSNPSRDAWFNKSAFAAPAAFTFGNLGRYALRTSAFWDVDASIFREFRFLETRSLEFRAEAFNLPNTAILGTPNGNLLDANFGRITGTANSERTLQLGVKIKF